MAGMVSARGNPFKHEAGGTMVEDQRAAGFSLRGRSDSFSSPPGVLVRVPLLCAQCPV